MGHKKGRKGACSHHGTQGSRPAHPERGGLTFGYTVEASFYIHTGGAGFSVLAAVVACSDMLFMQPGGFCLWSGSPGLGPVYSRSDTHISGQFSHVHKRTLGYIDSAAVSTHTQGYVSAVRYKYDVQYGFAGIPL